MAPGTDALDAFLAAESRGAAARLADAVIKRGVSFDDAYRRLQRGRTYGPARTGVVRVEQSDLGRRASTTTC